MTQEELQLEMLNDRIERKGKDVEKYNTLVTSHIGQHEQYVARVDREVNKQRQEDTKQEETLRQLKAHIDKLNKRITYLSESEFHNQLVGISESIQSFVENLNEIDTYHKEELQELKKHLGTFEGLIVGVEKKQETHPEILVVSEQDFNESLLLNKDVFVYTIEK